MADIVKSLVGARVAADNTPVEQRADRTGAVVSTDAHGRFQEANLRGTLYSGGMTLTSISNATFTTATLTASCTPIAGVWNPSTSTKNLVILQVKLQAILTALQCTGAGAYMWASSVGNTAISTGNTPLNRSTQVLAGSLAKDMSGVALTGLTNNLVVRDASAIGGGSNYNASLLGTAVGFMPPQCGAAIDHVDGSYIVPPGGVLALLCTTTPVAVSAASSIMWEEVSI
jgi:hypothetical protein